MQYELITESFSKIKNGYYIDFNTTPTRRNQMNDELLDLEKAFGSMHRLQRDMDRNIF